MVSIFTSQTPDLPDLTDATAYTLGTSFSSSIAASCTGARWYFPATLPGGTVTAALWTDEPGAEGTLLASKAFTSPTGGTWNSVTWDTPVSLSADTMYIVGIHTPDRYVATAGFFSAAGLTNGILTAIQDNTTAPSGGGTIRSGRLAIGGSPTFPNLVGSGASYFADVIVSTGQTVAVGIAAETDTAVALGRTKTKALGTATETDTAFTLARTKRRTLGTTAELDTAQAFISPSVADVDIAIGKPRTAWSAGKPRTAWTMGVPR